MKLYLNCENGGRRMGEAVMNLLEFHRFDGVRQAIYNGQPEESIREQLEELRENNKAAVLIVGGWDWWNDGDTVSDRDAAPSADMVAQDTFNAIKVAQDIGLDFRIEIGNEPNLAPAKYKESPRTFALLIKALTLGVATAERFDYVQFVSGGVSNINPWDGLAYLRALVDEGLPNHVELGFHPYRMGNRPHQDIGDRTLESIATEIVGLHPAAIITEGGWHTAPRRKKRGFPACFTYKKIPGWNDEELAEFAGQELDFWADHHVEGYTCIS